LEIRAIQTFHYVVALGGFQKAAEELNYSQPAITFRIKQLEKDLGVKLFERGKTLKLTSAGRIFYNQSKQLLQDYEALDAEMSQLRAGARDFIRIGISEPFASLKFPAVLADFLNRHPEVSVDVYVDDANGCSQRLEKGEIDFAVCGEPEIKLENYYDPFYSDELVLLVGAAHPLAKRAAVSLADLRGERLIFTPVNCPIRIQIEQALHRKIGNDYKKMTVTSSSAHKFYVQQNIGISILTKTATLYTVSGTKVIRITDVEIHPPIGILLNEKQQGLSQIVKDLMTEIQHSFFHFPAESEGTAR